jgi:SAM-dependent methyltransferase
MPNVTAAVDLRAVVATIAARSPGRTEATLQSDIRILLLQAPLALQPGDLVAADLETPVGVRKRIDIETGSAVIEVKRDLRVGSVRTEAEEQLAGYVGERSKELGHRYVGVLTDGAEWRLYHLTVAGTLQVVSSLELDPHQPDLEGLIVWLESVLATTDQVPPTPTEIERRLGATSPAHALDQAELMDLFRANRTLPGVALKRELWAKLLTTAFGSAFTDSDDLFVEHTLLVTSADIIAHAVVGFDPKILSPATILGGGLFSEAQIRGVVDEDFFDWILEVKDGPSFVHTLAQRLSRFAWGDAAHDVMKVLYESVISAAQRHSLGEYYTPDWLAERMVAETIDAPLTSRVVDPACGSGTFLFHSVRHYLAAAATSGYTMREALEGVCNHVLGIDVHPVAVSLARVTYLLAIGLERIRATDRGPVYVPVYLGDSLQWGQRDDLLSAGLLSIPTQDGSELFASELRFPDTLLEDAGRFDSLVSDLADRAAARKPGSAVPNISAVLARHGVGSEDRPLVSDTFSIMCQLHDQGRDHIWGYYVRNLARSKWLARAENRADVLIGNPPWLTFNSMTPDMKTEFRRMSENYRLWSGAGAKNHDLSALFVVRMSQLYLKYGGRLSFVMPFAALSRRQFRGFRSGRYLAGSEPVTLQFANSWDLDGVRPHPFPVPASVIFATRTHGEVGPMPKDTSRLHGKLPSKNLPWSVAAQYLSKTPGLIEVPEGEHLSPYAKRFQSGAKLNPQVLVMVRRSDAGPLGVPAGFIRVESYRSKQEKPPWATIGSLSGVVEAEFVRPMHLGSTVVPFRTLRPLTCVVPWDPAAKRLLDVGDERLDFYPGLKQWWVTASELWTNYGTAEKYSFTGRVDFQKKLSHQFPILPLRVVYGASGNRIVSARIDDARAVLGHMLYWAAASSVAEARYLEVILNSEALTDRVTPLQSRGQFGARHFDKYVFYIDIPSFQTDDPAHQQIADLGEQAEKVAAAVQLKESSGFHVARESIRQALKSAGLEKAMETAVNDLFGPA